MSTTLAKRAGNTQLASKSSNDIRSIIQGEDFKQKLAECINKTMTPERVVRVALTAIDKNPKLLSCTPASFTLALLRMSELGLEPNGRDAHLVPYGTTCTLVLDYKGTVSLILRGGTVTSVHADVVCKNDVFKHDKGVVLTHTIDFELDNAGKRGDVYAVYCIAKMVNGGEKHEVMTKRDVEKVRQVSKQANGDPWVLWWNEMAKKTVVKKASKYLPLTPAVRDAIHADDDFIEGEVVNSPAAAKTLSDLANMTDTKGEQQADPALYSKCWWGLERAKFQENLDVVQGWLDEGDKSDWQDFHSEEIKTLMDEKRAVLPKKPIEGDSTDAADVTKKPEVKFATCMAKLRGAKTLAEIEEAEDWVRNGDTDKWMGTEDPEFWAFADQKKNELAGAK